MASPAHSVSDVAIDAGGEALIALDLTRDAFGRLTLIHEGRRHEGVVPVRAFPIGAPDEGVGLMSAEGHELLWIPWLGLLTPAAQAMIEQELSSREFMPQIHAILGVSAYATPSAWTVQTDRGDTTLMLKAEEDIRRLPGGALLVADAQGIHFLIRDPGALDRRSRRILDRFL